VIAPGWLRQIRNHVGREQIDRLLIPVRQFRVCAQTRVEYPRPLRPEIACSIDPGATVKLARLNRRSFHDVHLADRALNGSHCLTEAVSSSERAFGSSSCVCKAFSERSRQRMIQSWSMAGRRSHVDGARPEAAAKVTDGP
jgi:hypothetical protein